MGTLYYGDNLDILRRYLDDESVDLVYLDPPFNSAQNYNAFFQGKDGTAAASQIAPPFARGCLRFAPAQAFEDTWEWNQDAERVYGELIVQPGKVSEVIQAFMTFLGRNDMMAYLAMMAPRLVELRRVLKKTGSLYLHCDPTASHYLKLLLDAVFGPENFRNEITWKRTHRQGNVSRNYGSIADTILFYAGEGFTWNQQYVVKDVRDLRGTVEREGALIGVLITMGPPIKPMLTEAAGAGFYESKVWQQKYPKLQILTIAELLEGRAVERPPTVAIDQTYKRAPKAQVSAPHQPGLGL